MPPPPSRGVDESTYSYRSLETLCREQAKISDTPAVRDTLERMAHEYKQLADRQEHQRSRRSE
jgi:hypothetical protein